MTSAAFEKMTAQLAMQVNKFLLFILFQEIINTAVANAVEEPSVKSISRSAFFVSRKNTRLVGHAINLFYSPSLLLCGQVCLSKTWCTSVNFKVSFKKDGKGPCELNKHDWPLIDEHGILSQQGVTFSLLLKVSFVHYFLKLIFQLESRSFNWCFTVMQSGMILIYLALYGFCLL